MVSECVSVRVIMSACMYKNECVQQEKTGQKWVKNVNLAVKQYWINKICYL